MKKTICWFTLLCLLLTAAPAALAEGDAHAIDSRTMTFYYNDPDTATEHTVYFIDGSDVPYLSLADWPAVMDGPEDGNAADAADAPEADDADANDSARDTAGDLNTPDPTEEAQPDLAFSMEGSVGTLTRQNGYSVTFDCDADVIHFLDYDAYMRPSEGNFLIDMFGTNFDIQPDGTAFYIGRLKNSYERFGKEVTINAGDYGIDFIADGGSCYVPMQTLGDILLSHYGWNIFYNGEFVVVASPKYLGKDVDNLTPLGEMYYSVEPHERSEAMARFTYGELCLALDSLYGLKDNHGIHSFMDLAEDTGLVEGLTSTNPVEADAALYQLLEQHLDDQHTGYNMPSPASGAHAADTFVDDLGPGQCTIRFWQQAKPYGAAREKAYPEGVPAYEEVGNTAFITFDGFESIPDGVDYYSEMPTAEAEDTMGIMIYAYSQITRPDSPIENVVLDLSCNLGGSAETAVYTIAAFLGVCSVSSRNTLSGALVTGNYKADLNLDGIIDDGDTGLLGKNLYCLESPVSFSCGNLVPCAFKHANTVSLLGRPSGGGACVVRPLTTADGSLFQVSGELQLSFLKNGAFYDIDQGAEPDFPLMKPDSFYDRPALVDYINAIR